MLCRTPVRDEASYTHAYLDRKVCIIKSTNENKIDKSSGYGTNEEGDVFKIKLSIKCKFLCLNQNVLNSGIFNLRKMSY